MRRGVSLMEVMFAILVVSIGLLAALTVFPVAASLAKKGEIADAASISGRAAVHEFDVRGMRQPANWIAWNPVTSSYAQFSPVFGESYCIDPRGIAANPTAQAAMSAFPYSATATQPRMRRLTLSNGLGVPMSLPLANSIFRFDDDATVVRPDDRSIPAHGTFTAGGVRNSEGHLSWMATLCQRLELNDIATRPPIAYGNIGPYSVPPIDHPPPFDDRPGQNFPNGAYLAPYPYPNRGTDNTDYLLSVIVFHDRPADMTAGDPLHERVVHCDFADAGGTGLAGGEAYLTWDASQSAANDSAARDVLKVRAGHWIMLAGIVQHRMGGEASYCRWYRVTEADHEPEYHPAEGHYAIAASLAGSDWPLPAYGELGMPGTPPIAVLMTGVVGVIEKTVTVSDFGN